MDYVVPYETGCGGTVKIASVQLRPWQKMVNQAALCAHLYVEDR